MHSTVLKSLLAEAADRAVSPERCEAIRAMLRDAVWTDTAERFIEVGVGIDLLINALFSQAHEHCPERLPSLHPIFVILCGDRPGMLELLKEASKPECNGMRVNEIHLSLKRDLSLFEGTTPRGRDVEMRLILDRAFRSTVERRPEMLPSMLPLFSMLCGDRSRKIIADADFTNA